MTTTKGPRRRLSKPQYFEPPEDWDTFTVMLKLSGTRHIQKAVTSLTDAELRWVGRVVAAELNLRVSQHTKDELRAWLSDQPDVAEEARRGFEAIDDGRYQKISRRTS